MSLYSDITLTHYDLTSSSADDVTSPPSAPTPPLNPAPLLTDQPEEHHHSPSHQTDQSELGNDHGNPGSLTTFNDQPAHHPTLVQSETLNVTENANYFLSTDPTDQLDASNPPRLSIVSSHSPDLECSICFSQFNNAFRCPKMLQCGHTFCLECLARMNVKSPEPSALLCPLCRAFTPLPALGLPRLSNDTSVLSCLPSPMQRVYSVRFVRNKGRLQLKRPDSTLTQSMRRSVDVGLPSPVPRDSVGRTRGGMGGALFRLTGRPACRAVLLTAVISMIVLLTAIVVYLLTYFRTHTP